MGGGPACILVEKTGFLGGGPACILVEKTGFLGGARKDTLLDSRLCGGDILDSLSFRLVDSLSFLRKQESRVRFDSLDSWAEPGRGSGLHTCRKDSGFRGGARKRGTETQRHRGTKAQRRLVKELITDHSPEGMGTDGI